MRAVVVGSTRDRRDLLQDEEATRSELDLRGADRLIGIGAPRDGLDDERRPQLGRHVDPRERFARARRRNRPPRGTNRRARSAGS